MTHICIGNLTIIGSDNGLSPDQRQAITWTNVGIFLIGPLGTNVSEMLIEIHTFSLKKIHLKMSSGKWRPFCLGLNVLITGGELLKVLWSVMLNSSTFCMLCLCNGTLPWCHMIMMSPGAGELTHLPLGDEVDIFKLPQNTFDVKIGSGYVFLPPGIKLLPEPMLTQIYVAYGVTGPWSVNAA